VSFRKALVNLKGAERCGTRFRHQLRLRTQTVTAQQRIGIPGESAIDVPSSTESLTLMLEPCCVLNARKITFAPGSFLTVLICLSLCTCPPDRGTPEIIFRSFKVVVLDPSCSKGNAKDCLIIFVLPAGADEAPNNKIT
jgi:hypothetical protein